MSHPRHGRDAGAPGRPAVLASPVRRRLLAVLATACPLAAAGAVSEAWGAEPLRIIVGYTAGGAVDTLARLVGAALSRSLQEPLVVEDRPGAGGNLAVKLMLQSRADGRTLLLAANALAANVSLYQPPPFDLERDIAPVGMIGRVPVLIAVGADSPLRSLADLLRSARRKPDTRTFASPGIGSTPHLAMLQFEHAAHVRLRHIPYKGGAPAIADALAGEVDCVAVNALEVVDLARSGRMRVLALMSPRPSPRFPGVPTIAQSGYPGFAASVWYGLVAPAGTPRATVLRLNAALRQALADPAVRRPLLGAGGEIDPGTPEQFGRLLLSERARYAALIRNESIHTE